MPGQALVTIGEKQWSVAMATTPEELTQGLGGVAAIAPGTGMLFDLGQDQVIQVTTVPMLFPLDIVFIHSSQGVVGVARNAQPGFLVTSDGPARFFLEVNAGEAEGVQAGDPALIEVAEAVGDGGVASIVNFGVAIGTLALVMGMMRPMVRAVLPRPKRPALRGSQGRLLPQTEASQNHWVAVYEDTRTHEMAEFSFRAASRGDADVQAGIKLRHYIRRGVLDGPLDRWVQRSLVPTAVRFIGSCKVIVASGWCESHEAPATEKVRCRESDLTSEEWRMAWEVAEQAFPGGQQPPATGLQLLPQVGALPVEGWRPKSMQEVEATVAKYANAMRQGMVKYRAQMSRAVVKYEGSVEKAIHYYRRYVIGEYERGRERPALAPAVIGPRERRKAPEEMEFFADSAEQLLASTNPYRAQTDAAFREAIERVRTGR
ncbi:MAG: DUF192 domain-containing protein [Chloroflexota bacterium]|nr:DUF192 domain-containing protein [Chloroflexota bacterium]